MSDQTQTQENQNNPNNPTTNQSLAPEDTSPESINLDQTDFYDQSSFSLPEKEVFPPLKLKKPGDKEPNPNRKLFILVGVVLGILFLLLIIVILINSQNGANFIFPTAPELAPGQIRLEELKSDLQSTRDLQNSLVLPQIQQPIAP